MEFTDEQKVLIALLTSIHKKLDIDDGLDSGFIQDVIMSGNTWALYWKYPGVFSDCSETPLAVKRVADVLDMWEVLERTLAGFTPAEMAQAKTLADPIRPAAARFPGYGANNEEEYLIVRILVDDLERWTSFSGRDFNAHMAMVDIYDRMLGAFQRVNPKDNWSLTLTVSDFAEVLREIVHPDNR
ncbi:YfbU family protein [Pseudomonas asplenii]|uniref:YfbU family protein n=1 Tax=Pseudomonas asplenii TaxID=53407 RepID=A0A1H6P2B4_9PSED|nr:YfbU family protein [Pseudomonas fuscovaginae]SEI23624.1 hypothetical protein SAMN05216581_5242 [Pseudomonas fuscovaginae]